MKILIALVLMISLNGCAGCLRNIDNGRLERAPYNSNLIHSPGEAKQYVKNHVDAKTLKKWDRAISDDVGVIEQSADGSITVR